MHDYENIPHLNWTDNKSVYKAKAQILRQEPLILIMPDHIDLNLDADECGCTVNEDTGILFNCDPSVTLVKLADMNDLPDLKALADAASESGSPVDVDADTHRIIFHD
jgi:hypothetical protein